MELEQRLKKIEDNIAELQKFLPNNIPNNVSMTLQELENMSLDKFNVGKFKDGNGESVLIYKDNVATLDRINAHTSNKILDADLAEARTAKSAADIEKSLMNNPIFARVNGNLKRLEQTGNLHDINEMNKMYPNASVIAASENPSITKINFSKLQADLGGNVSVSASIDAIAATANSILTKEAKEESISKFDKIFESNDSLREKAEKEAKDRFDKLFGVSADFEKYD